jgi:membrane associated rhomboid family serine protease
LATASKLYSNSTGTLVVILSIVVFWPLQFGAVYLFGDIIGLFRVTSVTPSVGWILSPLSHGWIDHLLQNIIGLLILGTAAERYLKTKHYLVIFFVFSVVSNVAAWLYISQFYPSPESVSGASGSVYAFGAFYAVHAWKSGDIQFSDKPGFLEAYIETFTSPKWLVWLAGIAVIIHGLGMSLADIGGIVGSSETAHLGHGTGVVLGFLLAYSVRDDWLRESTRQT